MPRVIKLTPLALPRTLKAIVLEPVCNMKMVTLRAVHMPMPRVITQWQLVNLLMPKVVLLTTQNMERHLVLPDRLKYI